ncbi:hypothetical protein FOC1_g10007516 [Fusarium oxysporum f. sp. cubense race 1]|uniref:Uncharacterized protein n=1 Tax=Fusarium oxysporum f. sp. cubense (strain race 1) TaxID=1229664 RepID=N4U612_FUSC1|nr:hypothetical protein FOC1_g10007516 [Fusarium oxysporum f. sp. cubense race 1]
MDQLMALLIELPPEARLRKVGYPSEADLTDASAYPSCLVPEAITYAFGTEAHFAFLFKICMHKCDENPICLFSPVRGLRAETHQPIWGHTFCIELCRLMSHPVFEMEGTNNLTLILQTCVNSHLRDLRKSLHNESPPRCIKARDLTADDPLYREQQDGIKTYLTDPKHLIFAMLQLAKVVQDSPKIEGPYITKERSFEVYSVTTLDLQNIRKALDTMELHCGEGSEAGLFEFPTDIIFPRYVAKTGVENDAPRDSEELSDLIVAGFMKREREIFNTILGRNRQ